MKCITWRLGKVGEGNRTGYKGREKIFLLLATLVRCVKIDSHSAAVFCVYGSCEGSARAGGLLRGEVVGLCEVYSNAARVFGVLGSGKGRAANKSFRFS